MWNCYSPFSQKGGSFQVLDPKILCTILMRPGRRLVLLTGKEADDSRTRNTLLATADATVAFPCIFTWSTGYFRAAEAPVKW